MVRVPSPVPPVRTAKIQLPMLRRSANGKKIVQLYTREPIRSCNLANNRCFRSTSRPLGRIAPNTVKIRLLLARDTISLSAEAAVRGSSRGLQRRARRQLVAKDLPTILPPQPQVSRRALTSSSRRILNLLPFITNRCMIGGAGALTTRTF